MNKSTGLFKFKEVSNINKSQKKSTPNTLYFVKLMIYSEASKEIIKNFNISRKLEKYWFFLNPVFIKIWKIQNKIVIKGNLNFFRKIPNFFSLNSG